MRRIFLVIFFSFVLFTNGQSQNDYVTKPLKSVTKYSYPICKEKQGNCFGYGYPDGPGPVGEIRSLCIIDSNLYIVDSYTNKVSKLNLNDGMVIKQSKPFSNEVIGTLDEILYFQNKLLVLSNSSGFLYLIDEDLNITKSYEIPLNGYFFKFFFRESILYILSSQSTLIKGGMEDHVAFNVGNNFTFSTDTIKINSTAYWDSIFVYGKISKIYEQSGSCYFYTSNIAYETPELLPQFDYYTHAVGYNDKYLAYIVRNESFYELTVCKY